MANIRTIDLLFKIKIVELTRNVKMLKKKLDQNGEKKFPPHFSLIFWKDAKKCGKNEKNKYPPYRFGV